jgi:hypothetical protein
VGQFAYRHPVYAINCNRRICDTWRMPSRSSKTKSSTEKRRGTDHDFAVNAFRVVEQAIGERMDGSPLPEPDAGKNPHAVALGRMGGAKGGAARAKALTPARRKAIARKAAKVRWKG